MLGAVERRFGNELPASPVIWIMVHATANETRQFARCWASNRRNTAVCGVRRVNGIVMELQNDKPTKKDSIMLKPDGLTAAATLQRASSSIITNGIRIAQAPGYRSPLEISAAVVASNGLYG